MLDKSKTYQNCSPETKRTVRKIIDELEEAGELAVAYGTCGFCGAPSFGFYCPECGAC